MTSSRLREGIIRHLFITFALYFTIMLGSIIIAENTMQKWALERPSKAILEERRHALGKALLPLGPLVVAPGWLQVQARRLVHGFPDNACLWQTSLAVTQAFCL